ncbi:MAG TPA: RNA polymerase factor sigma-54 [Bacteroidetes bacterium]|nr:RNA polymerase factor sigma-54 [Bacteroidota bacterium]
MLNQKLSQKLLQKLSPQQIQLIKLLQVPSVQMEQRVKQEIEENPALEEGLSDEDDLEKSDDDFEDDENNDIEERNDDVDVTDYMSDDEVADYKLASYGGGGGKEEKPFAFGAFVTKSFHEHLIQQMGMRNLPEERLFLTKHLIGNIDDSGYIRRPLIAIVDDLAFTQNIITTEEKIEGALNVIHDFDPPGVGARDLRECLLIQIRKKDDGTRSLEDAELILEKHFDGFSKKQYDRLQKRLNFSKDTLKDAINEILKLNPKPGSAYSDQSKNNQYIIPDFILSHEDGEYRLSLNGRNAPELKISPAFKDILKGYSESKKPDKKQKETVLFIKQKIDSAKWFIDAIKQRQETLLTTMKAILDYQYEFFSSGDDTNLRPMILKDIATITGFDISTISRVSNSKYIQTEFGTYSLKFFFSESMTNEDGKEISTKEIKSILKDIIESEDKKKPFSDQALAVGLKTKGYNIARRTVAKYREQMSLPVARLRKEL